MSGYLTKKKSDGKHYLYLRKSFREGGKVKHINLYSFGPLPKALEYLYWLRNNPEAFPEQLKQHGFDLPDLYGWIMTVETRVTNTGRNFDW